jgi:hypothetical protein
MLSLLSDKDGTMRGVGGGDVLVVGTLRSGVTDRRHYSYAEPCGPNTERTVRLLSELQDEGKSNLTIVDLPNLARSDVETLLSAHLLTAPTSSVRGSPIDPSPSPSASLSAIRDLASLLLECCRGNPLLLRENLAHLGTCGLFTYNAITSSEERENY